ncbi:uncharacterized protein M421DRAFT_424672 [Didymella exigua CBS 183.55]|uniref:Uncharacterized protein n=1 Tax=Didymella exigua CBS 183.55 TaxID=1150837 RepID=A0A6A5RD88_9PLEO|nr:uncharacterized protein M421DRAFT_424672 [Didymella exigua CBS 183.55]KAF1924536.1 hypothetical protein M421DRAFT_424672 [Didymella exigua CBS 183.55]
MRRAVSPEIAQGISRPSTNHSAPGPQRCLPSHPQDNSSAFPARWTRRHPQLLDAGHSALQSHSVANIHLVSFVQQFAFSILRDQQLQGSGFGSRPRACSPPPHIPYNPPRASLLLEPEFRPVLLRSGCSAGPRASLRPRRGRQLAVASHDYPSQALEALRNVVIATDHLTRPLLNSALRPRTLWSPRHIS